MFLKKSYTSCVLIVWAKLYLIHAPYVIYWYASKLILNIAIWLCQQYIMDGMATQAQSFNKHTTHMFFSSWHCWRNSHISYKPLNVNQISASLIPDGKTRDEWWFKSLLSTYRLRWTNDEGEATDGIPSGFNGALIVTSESSHAPLVIQIFASSSDPGSGFNWCGQ